MRSSGPEQSVERILAATFDAISRHGLLRLSLSDVCRAAGVARGTLYRYFPTKEDLLDGLGARTRERFESALRDLRASTDTPDERLEGVLRILIEQEEEAAGDRMLQIEPLFVLDFFGRLLPYYSELVAATLEPFFDQVERQFDMKIDRLLMSEVLLRVRLSLILMPPQDNLFGTRLRAAWNATVERQIKRSSGR
ncbi:hypothetical protein GCM10011400_12020 [Paraburkholderia caffeinilytica]|uniref:HTH tetR-type domain-containing protein n=2 Tax=Paraburkholderia caffeinilytica TaxID=1761016 RepID=A0ABQ1LNH4_9BURK|nr:hypothetical protein GCM10011400_12020 [Paraburkholderia caffeinilytica]